MNSLLALRKITRPLYRIRGARRLPEWLRRRYASDPRSLWVENFDGDLRFHCRLDSHLGSHVFWQGAYSIDQLILLDRMLKPHMTFLDVGANEGEHTLFAAKRVFRGRVVSFEPCTAVYQCLSDNVKANGFHHVNLVKKGLGEIEDRFPLYGMSGLYRDGSRNEGMSTLHPRSGVREFLEIIEVIPLDEYVARNGLDRIDVMKIDVEGSELSVLRGAHKVLKNFHPILLLEANRETSHAAGYSTKTLLQHLEPYGYRFEVIRQNGRTEAIGSGYDGIYRDVLCTPI